MSKLIKKEKEISFLFLLMISLTIIAIAGISAWFSFGVARLLEINKLSHDEQIYFVRVFILILGIICILPLAYNVIKYRINQIEFFSPTIVFPLLYFAVFGLGALGLVARGDERMLKVIVCSVAGILFYYIGVMFTRIIIFSSYRQRGTSRVSVEWNPYLLKLVITGLVTISIAAMIYHFLKAGFPILQPDLEEKRVMIQRAVSNYIIFLMRLITPAFFFYFTYDLLYKKIKSISPIIFFCAGLLILTSLANRHDIFTFLMGALLIYNFAGKRIKITKLFPILLIGLTCVMLIGYYRLASLSYITPEKEFLLQAAGNNQLAMFFTYYVSQFTNYPLNFAIYLDTFPKILPFEWGYSFIRAINTAIIPGHQELFDEYVKSELGLNFLGGGINPTLLGELYANFGYPGLIGMSVYGAIIAYLYYRAIRYRNGISVVSYSFGLSCLLLGLIGGFFSFSLPLYYIIVITSGHLLMREKLFNLGPGIQ